MSMAAIRAWLERLVNDPAQELGRGARFLRFQIGLWRFCARRLREQNVTAMSAALSFQTIFALIPALVLALLVMRSVGALENSQQSLRAFLDASGFSQIITVSEEGGATQPASAPAASAEPSASAPPAGQIINVADRIEAVVAEVNNKLTFQRIGPVGGVLLIWTALSLLSTIEASLNRIFGAERDRSTVRRVLLYWSAMTLGPLVLTAASFLGRRAMATFQHAPGASWILVPFGWLGPVAVGVVVLAAVYSFLPNTQVRFHAALGGAVVAVPLWLVAKWGFALYVSHLVLKGNLYGVLGLLPLFLMWLNFSWLIFLFGAQLAHAAANLSRLHAEAGQPASTGGPSALLAAALAVARHFAAGRGPIDADSLAESLAIPKASALRLIERLESGGVLLTTEAGDEPACLPARPADRIRVTEVLALADNGPAHVGDAELAVAVGRVRERTAASLEGMTLADLLAESNPPTP